MTRRILLSCFMLLLPLFLFSRTAAACLNSSIAEMFILSGGEVSVTVQDSIDRNIAAEGTPLVDGSSGMKIDSELLIYHNPPLILGSVDTASHVKIDKQLSRLGFEVHLLELNSFDDFMREFKVLTAYTGRNDLYEKYGNGQKERIDRIIQDCASIEEKPTVLFIRAGSAFSSTKAKRTGDHFVADMINDLGGINIADRANALTESLSLESIVIEDPDVILVSFQGDEEASQAYFNSLLNQKGWSSLSAIENGRVHYLDRDYYHYKPASRWADAYEMMAEYLYPEGIL